MMEKGKVGRIMSLSEGESMIGSTPQAEGVVSPTNIPWLLATSSP